MTNQMALIPHGHRFFTFEGYATRFQFEPDGSRIDGLTHSRAELTVNVEESAYRALYEILEIWRECRNQAKRSHGFVSFGIFVPS